MRDVVLFDRFVLTFRKDLLPPSSGQNSKCSYHSQLVNHRLQVNYVTNSPVNAPLTPDAEFCNAFYLPYLKTLAAGSCGTKVSTLFTTQTKGIRVHKMTQWNNKYVHILTENLNQNDKSWYKDIDGMIILK